MVHDGLEGSHQVRAIWVVCVIPGGEYRRASALQCLVGTRYKTWALRKWSLA